MTLATAMNSEGGTESFTDCSGFSVQPLSSKLGT